MEVTAEGNLKIPVSHNQKTAMQKFKSPFKIKFTKKGNDIVFEEFVDADGKNMMGVGGIK
jgi:hypothetical protein